MTLIERNELRILVADDGMYLTNGETFAKEVYLGSCDNERNWQEVPEEEVITDGD